MSNRSIIHCWLLALAAVLSFARPAEADDKKAAAHYRQGKAYEKAGSFDLAITEYKAAYALDNKASHLFNIGRAYDAKNDPRTAIEYYDKFLAIESEGANAKLAREAKAVAVKKVTEDDAKKKVEDDARKKAEDAKKKDEQAKAKKMAAENHLRQAADFAQKQQWANVGDEFKAATEADGDPEHLFEAAEAYRKVPDLAKARATFEQYRDKVQVGGRSDLARQKIAEIAGEMSKADQTQLDQKVTTGVQQPPPPTGQVDTPKKGRLFSRTTWITIAIGLVAGGLAADLLPSSGKNGKLDATDFIAPVMYGAGATAVVIGVF